MAKNEAKIKFTAETGEFNKSIKQANDEMSQLRAELKLNETQMKSTGASVESLEKKHSLLESQLKASETKTEALSQKVQKAAEIFGENSTEVTNLKTQLANAQSAEEKVRQAIAKCNQELTDQKQAAEEAESATKKLTDKIDKQQSEVSKLKEEYVEAALKYGDTSDEAKKLAREIEDLSGELKESKSEFDKAERAADSFDKSLDDAGDSARDSADGFTVAKGAIADLASEAVQMAINKVSEFIDYLRDLPEATRELRQDMATLETSYESAGLSTEQATSTWKELYKIFGEDDRAVEAANLIAKMSKNQEDLSTWVTITKGVWGQYQDSLPVEGLAEASNETAKTGKVTGVLADALNWANTSGEKFGVTSKKNIEFTKLSSKEIAKLSDAEREEYERKKKLYEETEAYNKKVEEATSAEDYFNIALENCSNEQERQALITDTLTALYGDAATEYDKASGSQTEAKEATADNILVQNQMADAIEPVTTAWQGMKNEMLAGFLPVIEKVAGFLVEHPKLLKFIGVALGLLSVAVSALAIGWGVYTVAQWAANAAMLACPLTWIVGVIVAVIAVLAVIITYWDELKAAAGRCWKGIKSAWGTCVNFFKGLWKGIKNVFAPVGKWFSQKFKDAKNGIQNAWSGVKGFFSKIKNGIVNGFSNIKEKLSAPFKAAIDKIKGFFKGLKLKLPHINLPHFKIKGKFSLSPPSVPKLKIDWYNKAVSRPMLLNSPTIFGYSNGKFLGGGETKSEMIGGTSTIMNMIQNAVDRSVRANDFQSLERFAEELASRPIELNIDGRQFALATAGHSDSVNGLRNNLVNRGLILD